MTPTSDNVVIFDGVCNLCAASVRFILAHERDSAIRFTAAQSPAGSELLQRIGFDPEMIATFVYLDHGDVLVRSDAALAVARHLRLPWRLAVVLRWIPRFIRDRLYDFIARNRYRWFGQRESCLVPTAELRARFIAAAANSA